MNKTIDASAISIGRFLDISSQAVVRTRFESVTGEDFVRAASHQDTLIKVLRKVDNQVFDSSWGDLSGYPHWTGDPDPATLTSAHFGNPPSIPNTNNTQKYPAATGTGGGGVYYSRATETLSSLHLSADNSGAITTCLKPLAGSVDAMNFFNISTDGSVVIASTDGLINAGVQYEMRADLPTGFKQLTKPLGVYSGHWGQFWPPSSLTGTQPPLHTRLLWNDISGDFPIDVDNGSGDATEDVFRENILKLGFTNTTDPASSDPGTHLSVGPSKFFASSADCTTFVCAAWYCSTVSPIGEGPPSTNPKFQIIVKKALGGTLAAPNEPPTRTNRENGSCWWVNKGTGQIPGPSLKPSVTSSWGGLECPIKITSGERATNANIIKLLNISNFLAMSGDGEVIALREPIDTALRGQIRVYKYNGTDWKSHGSSFSGPVSGQLNFSGAANTYISNGSLSLDQYGNRLIAGGEALPQGISTADEVSVYNYNSAGKKWDFIQRITRTSGLEYSLWKTSMSLDGKFLCLASREGDPGTLGSGNTSEVKMYQLDSIKSGTYGQVGKNIVGDVYDVKISPDGKYIIVADKVELDNITGDGAITQTANRLGNGVAGTADGDSPSISLSFVNNDGSSNGAELAGFIHDISTIKWQFPQTGSPYDSNPNGAPPGQTVGIPESPGMPNPFYICTAHKSNASGSPTFGQNLQFPITHTYYSGVVMEKYIQSQAAGGGFSCQNPDVGPVYPPSNNQFPAGGLIMAFRFSFANNTTTLTDTYVQNPGSGYAPGDIVRPATGSFGYTNEGGPFKNDYWNAGAPFDVIDWSPSVGPYFKLADSAGGPNDAFDVLPWNPVNDTEYDGVFLKGSAYHFDSANNSWDLVGAKSSIVGRVHGVLSGTNPQTISSIGETNVDISSELSNKTWDSISSSTTTDTSTPITGPRVVMGNYGIKDLRQTVTTGTTVTFV